MQAVKDYKVTKFIPFNPVDKKTSATVTFPSGETVMTCKGAPQVRGKTVIQHITHWYCLQAYGPRACHRSD